MVSPEHSKDRRRKAFIIVMEAALCALLLFLLARAVDPAQLLSGLRRITPGAIVGVVCFQLTLIGLASWCWSLLLNGAGVRRGWGAAFGANLAGFAVTYLTPAITCSGAPVRVALYRRGGMRPEPILAAIALDTLVLAAGKLPTMMAGAALLIARSKPGIAVSLGAALALLLALIVGGMAALLRGGSALPRLARRILRLLAVRPRTAARVLRAVRRFAAQLDSAGRNGLAIRGALGVALLVALVEVGQSWFIMSVMGAASLTGALAVTTGTLVQGVIGILPGNMGGMEAVNALAFSLYGLGPSAGVSYSLILRVGQLSLVACGLGVLVISRLGALIRRTAKDDDTTLGYQPPFAIRSKGISLPDPSRRIHGTDCAGV
jgi:uncharacterized membrane protein YbhN (UPF0104 family)